MSSDIRSIEKSFMGVCPTALVRSCTCYWHTDLNPSAIPASRNCNGACLAFRRRRDYEQPSIIYSLRRIMPWGDSLIVIPSRYSPCARLVLKLAPRVRAESEVRILELWAMLIFALGALIDSAQDYAAAAARAQQAGLKEAQMRP